MIRRLILFILCLFAFQARAGVPPDGDPELLYEYRIAQLGMNTPIELVYNAEVRRYIDLYTGPRRADMARIIGLSKRYFPVFEDMLDRYGLPLELEYLTIIESGLDPLAVSKSGAVGLWQFLFNTARLFDLEVSSLVDERCDLYKSTDAACRYLNYLYNTFHDWQLVLSSYNGGPGDVRKAIARSHGETDYWKLRPYLSEQAGNYVPSFVAAYYVMHFYKEHGIVPIEPEYDFAVLDTLHLTYAVTFSQVSSVIGLDVAKIRRLNPVYRRDYIPVKQPWSVLVLPADKALLYLQNETRILGTDNGNRNYNQLLADAGSTSGRTRIIHVVQRGEFTHKIAMRYGVTLENIKAWNKMTGNDVQVGQKLEIWVGGRE
jgi:membrane-bound lytic murein transglycosylase D